MTDFRALCAELADELQGYKVAHPMHCRALLNRARTALEAQPDPQGPMPEVDDILRLAAIIRRVDGNHDKGAAALAEAILSHPDSRWQHAQPEPQGPSELELEAIELKLWDKHRTKGCRGEGFMYDNDFSAALDEYRDLLARPEPQGPTDAELDALFTEVDQGGECQSWRAFARAVLARWGTPAIQPVPVSERLPVPGVEGADG